MLHAYTPAHYPPPAHGDARIRRSHWARHARRGAASGAHAPRAYAPLLTTLCSPPHAANISTAIVAFAISPSRRLIITHRYRQVK